MKKIVLFSILSFCLCGCETRNSEIFSDINSDSEVSDVKAFDEIRTGGFLIRQTEIDSFSIGYGNLLLEGFSGTQATDKGGIESMFALRDVDIDYEMMYGSFKPKDRVRSRWVSIVNLKINRLSDNEIEILLSDSASEIGRVLLGSRKNTEGEYLEIKFDESERYNRLSLSFECTDEAFIGFGAQSIDVNHYGNELFGWVQEQGIGKVMHDSYDDLLWYVMGRKHSSHIPVPQILSSRNYVTTIMDDIRPVMSLCANESNRLGFEFSKGSSLYIFPADNPKEALKKATSVTGRSRVPPDFSFFPWIDAIFGSENVRRVAQKLRDNGIPASAIWTEDYIGAKFKGDRYILNENWNIDRTLYPDFEKLSDDLHNSGYKFLVYFNPFVFEDSDVFSELDSKGLLIRDKNGKTYLFDGHKGTKSSLIDLLNEDAVKWLKEKMNDIVQKGADGWMGDFAEWLPTDSFMYDSESKKDISGLLMHNKYPVLWQKVQREVLDSQKDGKERLFFARSGWFGTPQLADVIWAGDQRTSFDEDDGLPTIIPIGIGLGICGISNYGHDIAGYQSTTNPPSDKELFFRWTTLGAFSPVMRTHHGYMPKLNWSWESDDETMEFFKRYAKIHSQLFPYLKTLSIEANRTGIPVMRSLALEFPEDKIVWSLKDEYMLGSSILVAPVIKKGETSKKVYLPQGRWATFSQSGRFIEGGRYITVESPPDSIPVFVKAGSIIPMISEDILTNVDIPNIYQSGSEKMKERIVLLFLGETSSFSEYNGTDYILRRVSDYSFDKELTFSVNKARINECKDKESNCYLRDNNGRYSLFISSESKLEIFSENKKISEFEIKSKESFGVEIRLFY